MINELFKIKFPFAYNYFSNLLKENYLNRFPQSIIFEGSDVENSYYFALELARNLNCSENKTSSCDCVNCKWIKSYTHPAVNNVSQIHFKGEGDETKTQISTKQAREIEKSLTLSSDYHRFFIFFSSQNSKLKDNEYGYNPINFSIEPLNPQVFNLSCANTLLKSIEEPPKNTTFIFLAKSKEDILSTIVSRSQVFKLSSIPSGLDYSDIEPFLKNYFNMDYLNAINICDDILNYIKSADLNFELVLNKIIAYLISVMKENINNEILSDKINRDIFFIEDAIKHFRANMSEKTILETLFLKIVRGRI